MIIGAGKQYCIDVLAALAVLVWTTSTGVLDVWLAPPERPVSADDPALLDWVSSRLEAPSSLPYNLSRPEEDCWGQSEQVRVVQALTRNKTGGFFIESGALDGERFSNTLLLERQFGWSGLLIEPSPASYRQLRSRRRRAWALPACLSHTGVAFETTLHSAADGSSATVEDGLAADRLRKAESSNTATPKVQHRVTCVPIETVLRALGQTTVDFFSLDIEGPEMGVLAHIPWQELDIKILLVENFLAYTFNPQMDQMRDFMESQGYIAMHLMIDWIFIKRSSEYAQDAQNVIRRVRKHIATRNKAVHFPFND